MKLEKINSNLAQMRYSKTLRRSCKTKKVEPKNIGGEINCSYKRSSKKTKKTIAVDVLCTNKEIKETTIKLSSTGGYVFKAFNSYYLYNFLGYHKNS